MPQPEAQFDLCDHLGAVRVANGRVTHASEQNGICLSRLFDSAV